MAKKRAKTKRNGLSKQNKEEIQKRVQHTLSQVRVVEDYDPKVHILRMKEGAALFLLSTVVLAWLFSSWKSPLVFATLSGLALLLEHFFKVHKHESHHVFKIGWILFIPALVAFVAFRDLWGTAMLALITISLIVSIALHKHHDYVHSISSIMWRSTLGHVVAFTTALTFAVFWSQLFLGEALVSTLWMVAFITTPAVFIYYFLNKFIYIYFFERTTFVEDLKKTIPRTLAHAILMLIAVSMIYTSMGVGLYEVKTNYFNENAEQMATKIISMKGIISDEPEIMAQFEVNEEINNQIAEEIFDLSSIKPKEYKRLDVAKLVMKDEYYGLLVDEVTTFVRAATNALTLSTAKQEVADGINTVLSNKQYGTAFEDGSEDVDTYLVRIKSEVEPRIAALDRTTRYAQAVELLSRKDILYNDVVQITGDSLHEEVREFIEFQSPVPLNLHDPYTPAEETFVYIMRHTTTSKDVLRLAYTMINLLARETNMPEPIWKLIENRDAEESPESKAIRYRVIKSYLDAMES